MPLQLNPSNSLVEEKIKEIEKSLKDAGRQSDTELLKYYKDFINFLKEYQVKKFSYKYINEIAAGDGEDGEVGAARFIKQHVPVKEGQLKTASNDTKKVMEIIGRDENLYNLMMQTVIQHFEKIPNILENEFMNRFEEFSNINWNYITTNLISQINFYKEMNKYAETKLEINSKVALIDGKLKKADDSTNYKVPLSNSINEMGVPQVTQEQEPFENEVSKDYNGTPMATTDINDPNFFPDSGGSKDTTTQDDMLNRSLNNRAYSLKGFDKYSHIDEYRRDTEEMEDGEADKEFTVPIIENESENLATNIGKAGENKMWINSKLAVDENGNIKKANPTTEIKGEEPTDPIDTPKVSVEPNAIVTPEDKVSFIMSGSTEKYAELESIISKIAKDNNIDGIEEISIKLSKIGGDMEFKIAEESWDTGEMFAWIQNDESMYNEAMRLTNRYNSTSKLADALEESFSNVNIPNLSIRNIDWHELAFDCQGAFGDDESELKDEENIYGNEGDLESGLDNIEKNTGENKMGMWINSKLMLDEEGNIKEADIKEAEVEWGVNLKSDSKEEPEDDDDKTYIKKLKDKQKKNPSYKINDAAYAELESFISKIAAEKGIVDVSEISINLNKEAGIIEFKIADAEEVGKEIGKTVGTTAGTIAGSEAGPVGSIAGGEIGGVVGEEISKKINI